MSKEKVITRLAQKWQAFLQSFEGLAESALLEAGVCGEWSVRDIIAHTTTWEEETLKALPLILEKKTLPRYVTYGGIDGFNAKEHKEKQGLSLARIRRDLASTHQRLTAFLAGAPEETFVSGSRFMRRLSADTHNHYREHTEQILAWRGKKGP